MFSRIERQCKQYIQQLFTTDVDSLEETVFRNCGKNFLTQKKLKEMLFGKAVDIP